MDELGRRRAERLEQPPVERLVGPVVVAAHDVRDAEVDVVDHRREVIRGRAVLAQQGQAVEPVAQRSTGLAMAFCPLALPDRPLVPRDPEPLEIAEDRLLAARDVARSVGVVDPQQHPVAQPAVSDRAQGIAEVERARRARRKTDSDRHASSVRFRPRWSPGAQRFSAKTADPPLPTQAS